MFEHFNANPTQVTGIVSFAAAAFACMFAARHSQTREAIAWNLLAIVLGLLMLEVIFGFRHHAHDIAILAIGREPYLERRDFQVVMLGVLIACFTLLLFASLRWAPRRAQSATITTTGILALSAAELVSLHALDAVFYKMIGPVMLIGWLWALAAMWICFAAFRSRFKS